MLGGLLLNLSKILSKVYWIYNFFVLIMVPPSHLSCEVLLFMLLTLVPAFTYNVDLSTETRSVDIFEGIIDIIWELLAPLYDYDEPQ